MKTDRAVAAARYLRRIDTIPYRALQWAVAGFALLHNLEEGLTMPSFALLARERLSGLVPPAVLAMTGHVSSFYGALVFATIVPLLVVIVAGIWRNRATAWAVLLVQSVFLVNVFVPHVPAAVMLGGYAPGVVTAVVIQLPFSVCFVRRSVRERTVTRSGALVTLIMAVPALLLALAAFYWLAD